MTIAERTEQEERSSERRGTRFSAALARFVTRHVMVEDRPGYIVQDTGWPSGIKPPGMSEQQVEKMLSDAFGITDEVEKSAEPSILGPSPNGPKDG
ncbi:MAG TPA: hypothetical protein VFB74_20920 [Kribbellaceae bacterium]|nr:hypothetical protein [Kribbellaceae bacterium]